MNAALACCHPGIWLPPPRACGTLADDMDDQTKIEVCGLIAGMLFSDKEMDIHEAGFLQRIRKRFGVPKGAPVKPIVDHDEAVGKLQGFSEEVRKETLELLIQAAAADGKLAPAERSLLDVVAGALQVDPNEIDERVQQELAKSKPQPFAPAMSSDDD